MTELESLWRSKGDEELVEARRRLKDYTREARRVIEAELTRRGISWIPDESAAFPSDPAVDEENEVDGDVNPLECSRCEARMDYVGTRKFHEGTNWGIIGEIGELFVNKESFDVYVCPHCGKVEFFVNGIGEGYRPN